MIMVMKEMIMITMMMMIVSNDDHDAKCKDEIIPNEF